MFVKKPIILNVNNNLEVIKAENISSNQSFVGNFTDSRRLKILFKNASTYPFLIKGHNIFFVLKFKTGIIEINLKTNTNSKIRKNIFKYTILTNELLYSKENNFSFNINCLVENAFKKVIEKTVVYKLDCKLIEEGSFILVNNDQIYQVPVDYFN